MVFVVRASFRGSKLRSWHLKERIASDMSASLCKSALCLTPMFLSCARRSAVVLLCFAYFGLVFCVFSELAILRDSTSRSRVATQGPVVFVPNATKKTLGKKDANCVVEPKLRFSSWRGPVDRRRPHQTGGGAAHRGMR